MQGVIQYLIETLSNPWVLFGFFGQLLFTMRFLVQWLQSEKQRRSIIPTAFWVFSIAGSSVLLSYAIWREDPVIIAGQSFGLIIYIRNLYFILRGKRKRSSVKARDQVRHLVDDLSSKIHSKKEMSQMDAVEARELLAKLEKVLTHFEQGGKASESALPLEEMKTAS